MPFFVPLDLISNHIANLEERFRYIFDFLSMQFFFGISGEMKCSKSEVYDRQPNDTPAIKAVILN